MVRDPDGAREAVLEGFASIEQGESIELKDDAELREFFEDVVSRGKKRLAAKRKAAGADRYLRLLAAVATINKNSEEFREHHGRSRADGWSTLRAPPANSRCYRAATACEWSDGAYPDLQAEDIRECLRFAAASAMERELPIPHSA
jgi:hypothetical protein